MNLHEYYIYLSKVLISCSALIILFAVIKALKTVFSNNLRSDYVLELKKKFLPKKLIFYYAIYGMLLLISSVSNIDFGSYNYKFILGLIIFEFISHRYLHEFNKIKITKKFLFYSSLYKLLYLAPVFWCSNAELFYISLFALVQYMLISFIALQKNIS